MAWLDFVVSACGEVGGRGERQPAKARSLPEYAQDLRAGEYHTEVFKPSLSFSVNKSWALECPEAPDYVCLVPPGEETEFKFLDVQKVYKPSRNGAPNALATPDNLVGWPATPLPGNRPTRTLGWIDALASMRNCKKFELRFRTLLTETDHGQTVLARA